MDEPRDYKLIREITKSIDYEGLVKLSMIEICNYVLKNNLSDINSKVLRNSGWSSAFEKDANYLNKMGKSP